jgi:hypothetical protein
MLGGSRMKWTLLAGVGVVALAVLWVVNCSGPRPAVSDVSVSPPSAPGAPHRVQATVRNQGPGHGQVSVSVRLVDPAAQQTYQEDRKLALEAHETTRLVAEIHAPPGDYVPRVEVEYPPR